MRGTPTVLDPAPTASGEPVTTAMAAEVAAPGDEGIGLAPTLPVPAEVATEVPRPGDVLLPEPQPHKGDTEPEIAAPIAATGVDTVELAVGHWAGGAAMAAAAAPEPGFTSAMPTTAPAEAAASAAGAAHLTHSAKAAAEKSKALTALHEKRWGDYMGHRLRWAFERLLSVAEKRKVPQTVTCPPATA